MSNLLKMESTRKKPKQGDVFVIQPKESFYFYGRVMETKIQSTNAIIQGCNLVYLYKVMTPVPEMPAELRPDQLLMGPFVVNNQGWYQGFFHTIGNLPIKTEDIATNIGFKVYPSRGYVDVHGNPLSKEPELWTYFALGGFTIIGKQIQEYLEKGFVTYK